jgi:hypothetical protein
MDIHPNDKGYTTMVFKLTSPTLQRTLKICVGKPYDEGGRDKYNVYEVTDDNRIKVRNGYYLVDKGTVVMDDDGDFPIMKIGEPTWDNVDVKVPKEKEKEKEPEVSKSDFIVIDNDASGDCFYDAVIRAESNSADTYSGEKIGKLRSDIANFISKNPKFRDESIQINEYMDKLKKESIKLLKLNISNELYQNLYENVSENKQLDILETKNDDNYFKRTEELLLILISLIIKLLKTIKTISIKEILSIITEKASIISKTFYSKITESIRNICIKTLNLEAIQF